MNDKNGSMVNPSIENSTLDEMPADVKKSAASSNVASEVANEFKQRKFQRKVLFWSILALVFLSFIALIVFVFGRNIFALPGPAAVAAISALGVQPFVLIGILTTSVYKGNPVTPPANE